MRTVLFLWLLVLLWSTHMSESRAQATAARLDSLYAQGEADRLLQIALKKGDKQTIGFAYSALGFAEEKHANNPQKALRNYLKAQQYLGQSGDSLSYFKVGRQVARLLLELDPTTFKAEVFRNLSKAILYYRRVGNIDGEAVTLCDLSWIRGQQKMYDEAEALAMRGLALSKQAKNWITQFGCYISLLEQKLDKNEYNLGLEVAKSLHNEAIAHNDTISLQTALFYKGVLNQLLDRPALSIPLLLRADQLSTSYMSTHPNDTSYDALKFKRDVTKYLSQCYATLTNYKAAHIWGGKHVEWQEALSNYQNYSPYLYQGIVETLASSKVAEIADLKRQQLQKQAAWQAAIITLTVVVTILMIILAIVNFRRTRTLKQVSIQRQEIANQQLELLQNEHALKQIQLSLQTQENERKRIGRDLHDGLGGLLSLLRLTIQSPSIISLPQQTSLLRLVDEACDELRSISTNLNPVTLDRWGLKAAVNDFIVRMRGSFSGTIDLQVVGVEIAINHEERLSIYRIVQELITNAIRHSEARHIWVELIFQSEQLHIKVEDDGKGFMPSKTGSGLANIQQRVDNLKAYLDIMTDLNKGTTFYLTFR